MVFAFSIITNLKLIISLYSSCFVKLSAKSLIWLFTYSILNISILNYWENVGFNCEVSHAFLTGCF